jgi:Ca-activated chloride channel family protein
MTRELSTGLIPRHGSRAQAIPLIGVRVRARISGPCVEVTLVQRYHNTEPVPVEAVYIFPLDEGAAVCGFSARIGESLVEGEVVEREQAFVSYDDALIDGNAAFLLEQERPNVFTASVGNLLAGEQVELTLRYVAGLEREGEALRLTIPTTVAPRYVAKEPPRVGQPDGERVNPEQRESVPYGLSLEVEIAGAVRSIDSPSHPVRTRLGPESVAIELSQEDVALDRDFVLLVTPPLAPRTQAAYTRVAREPDGRRVAMVSFQHTLQAAPGVGHEVIFVLDCSGSMQGSSITQARRALSLCIRALESDDTFNVVRFGSSFESLFPDGPRRFDESSLSLATRYVEQTEASLGGTELLLPLEHVLSSAPDPARPRRVLLLTDGQVSNEAEVIALAREHRESARVFTFAIGASASAYLVRGIARATRAATELIAPGERIEPKVLRMFQRVRTPVLDDVRIDWCGLEVESAPSEVPSLFAGDDLTVFARIVSGSTTQVQLSAGKRVWSVSLDLERAESGGPIPTLWARERIRAIEESDTRAGSAQRDIEAASRRGLESAEARRALLVELGTRYQLLTSATSFVAVQVRSAVERSDQAPQLRRIPVALTHGRREASDSWAGGFVGAPLPMIAAPAAPMRAPMPGAEPMILRARTSGADTMRSLGAFEASAGGSPEGSLLERAVGFFKSRAPTASAPAEHTPEAPDRLYDLLMTQRADGRFESSPALLRWLGLERAARLAAAIAEVGEAAVVTALVVLLLEREAQDRGAEWRPAVHKARRWLAAHAKTFDASCVLSG